MAIALGSRNVLVCRSHRAAPVARSPSPLKAWAAAPRRGVVAFAEEGKGEPSTTTEQATKAADEEEDMPIWVRREKERELLEKEGKPLPWGLYLLASVLIAIAAVGCIFEFIDGNAFFGIIQPDSPLWAPILLTLAVTGIPSSAFMFIKGVNGFNEDAERQDRIDGYID